MMLKMLLFTICHYILLFGDDVEDIVYSVIITFSFVGMMLKILFTLCHHYILLIPLPHLSLLGMN